MSHPYMVSCDCQRCLREQDRRARQAASDPRRAIPARRSSWRRSGASRAEQQARYIDCGPQAWDDRGDV